MEKDKVKSLPEKSAAGGSSRRNEWLGCEPNHFDVAVEEQGVMDILNSVTDDERAQVKSEDKTMPIRFFCVEKVRSNVIIFAKKEGCDCVNDQYSVFSFGLRGLIIFVSSAVAATARRSTTITAAAPPLLLSSSSGNVGTSGASEIVASSSSIIDGSQSNIVTCE
jgi:hypothetical protein